ncbi:hypothetical protein PFISCL1PPCAC_13622, partial [Pristionchus fissidentatus]
KVKMRVIIAISLLLASVHSFKFLVFSTRFGSSHTNFLARISDVLVDAGHEVVIVSPIMNSIVGGPMTKKARVIEIPQCQKAADFEDIVNNAMTRNVWVMQHPVQMLFEQRDMFATWGYVCESVVTHPGLIDQLKAENFDAAVGESFDMCGAVLFHLLGIDKWAVTDSVAIKDGGFHVTHTPSNPAYVPSLMGGSGEKMDFLGRLSNTFSYMLGDFFFGFISVGIEESVRKHYPDLPSMAEIESTNSLVFYNSEPLVDFPKVTSARTIDIGGITVSSEHKPLNKTWSDMLNLRPKTILISFGTVAKAFAMPEEYKQTIRETLKKFPDVTFIWKYEKPEHNISDGIPNLIESTWVPQRDMLHDPRLSAFITHCGQGSTTESIDAGIPLIVIPVMADQQRNAYQVERIGVGLRMDKTDLKTVGKLDESITEILRNYKYRHNARRVKNMIADRPFQMKEIFVKNMEFLAKHGPLRQLDHYGRHLNFFQYYLIDVIAFVLLAVAFVCLVFGFIVRSIIKRVFTSKSKQD